MTVTPGPLYGGDDYFPMAAPPYSNPSFIPAVFEECYTVEQQIAYLYGRIEQMSQDSDYTQIWERLGMLQSELDSLEEDVFLNSTEISSIQEQLVEIWKSVNEGGIVGPPGETGPPGPQGDPGPAGPEGPAGEAGPPGPQGDPGPQGEPGEDGAAGEQGPPGDAGPQGEPGPQGEAGVDGSDGDTGPPGPEGPAGETGPPGPQGDPGPHPETQWDGPHLIVDGVSGPDLTGPPGPEGEVGPAGEQGPQGEDGAAGEQGPPGDTGPQGDPGPQGEDGPAGPPGVDGEDGPAGEQGPQGDPGPEGPEGPQGEQGPQGEEGPIGPEGPEGPEGPQGETGPTGADGAPGAEGEQGEPGPTLNPYMMTETPADFPTDYTIRVVTNNGTESENIKSRAEITGIEGIGGIIDTHVIGTGAGDTAKVIERIDFLTPIGYSGDTVAITSAEWRLESAAFDAQQGGTFFQNWNGSGSLAIHAYTDVSANANVNVTRIGTGSGIAAMNAGVAGMEVFHLRLFYAITKPITANYPEG